MGFRPIILERGKPVRERTKDTWALWRRGVLNPESNVQFGEGGAGTFSDGKLYSRHQGSAHLARKLLTEFVEAGAPEEILYRQQTPYRHLPPGHRGREHPRQDRGPRRRIPFFVTRSTDLDLDAETAHIRGLTLANGDADRRRRRRARDRPQRPRHLRACCTAAASTSKPSRSPSAPASSTRSR